MKCTTHLGVIFTFISIVIICEINSYTIRKDCSAWDNRKWIDSKKKCVPCRACPAGRARNFSSEIEVKTGPNGDLQCLPCEECPDGYYVRIPDAKGIPSMCALCSADCASRNRYMTKACSSLSNWECGDCLSGFENAISNDFPCHKILTNKLTNVVTAFSNSRRITEHENVTNPNHTHESTASLPGTVDDVSAGLVGQNESSSSVAITIVVIVAAVLAVAALVTVAVLVIGCLCKKSCRQKFPSSEKLSVISVDHSSTDNSSTTLSLLSTDSDLEVDCRGVGDRTPPPRARPEPVRGELSNSASIPTEHLNRVSADWHQISERTAAGRPQIVCRCPTLTADYCRESCDLLMFKPSLNIGQNTDLITVIANNVCHHPLELFRDIGAKDSDVYNLNDDRLKFPDRVSQKDFIYNVLKRWLQVNSEAKSHALFRGLCHGGFHRINKAIYDQYNDLFPQL